VTVAVFGDDVFEFSLFEDFVDFQNAGVVLGGDGGTSALRRAISLRIIDFMRENLRVLIFLMART
jgi:hypothetical protein